MTPKEKANELVGKFKNKFPVMVANARGKQCALITVDEIIQSTPIYPNDADWDDCGATHKYYYEAQLEEAMYFWQEVKQEIEKL